MTKKTLKPTDFDQQTVHFLELDYLDEDFPTFVDRHLVLLRYAYTVAEGGPNQTLSVGDGYVERIYTPYDKESYQEFFDRVRASAKDLKLTRLFYHADMPMVRVLNGHAEAVNTMAWYARDGEAASAGSMDKIVRPGEFKTLGPNQPANGATFAGWLADQLRSFL
jgi:hypothetical protein